MHTFIDTQLLREIVHAAEPQKSAACGVVYYARTRTVQTTTNLYAIQFRRISCR